MRTADEIREDLEALDQTLAAFGPDVPGAELPGVGLMQRELEQHRAGLVDELAHATASDLTLVLDGPAVAAGAIEAVGLVERLGPFAKLVNSIAQAIETGATAAGLIPGEILERTSMIVTGIVPGSFGLQLTPPSVDEPMSLFDDTYETLFERSVRQTLDILDAASAEDYEQAIIDNIGAIGTRATGHLNDLAKAAASSSEITRIEVLWRSTQSGQPRRSVLNAARGSRIQDVLATIDVEESERPIAGRLVEASLPAQTFGVEIPDGDVIQGRVDEAIAHRIEEYFGKEIAGTLRVLTTSSTASGKSTERYTLIAFAGPLDP